MKNNSIFLFKDIGVMTVISQEKIICGELL